ncbi:MAG: multicopper oxidase family protein [Beijerinckiaceae bacterium]
MSVTRRHLLGSILASLVVLPLRARAADDGPRKLEARKASLRLSPEPAAETEVWGFDGEVPGPLLRYKKGAAINLRLVNSLDQPLTLSFQGLRHENAFDGVAGLTQKPVLPGQSFDYRFTPPDSGFYWYRSHVLPCIPEQLGRGLYGPLIIDEANPPIVDHDMLLVLEDWKLDDKAQIAADFGAPAETLGSGRIGKLVTAESKPVPVAEKFLPGSRLRLRILSVANARIMFVSFLGVRPFVLAVDGQPCEAFEPVRHTLPIGPGARFDVMLDLPREADAEASLVLRGFNEPDQPILTLKTEGEARKELAPIGSLEDNPRLPKEIKLQTSRRVDIILEGGSKPEAQAAGQPAQTGKPVDAAKPAAQPWTLNGQALKEFGPTPLFSVKRGTAVTLGFVNKTAFLQQMHVHGHNLRLLHDLDDGWEPYWRDCVIIPEGRTKHVAFIADNPGKWVIESLIAERQAAGMLTWFEVT